MKIFYALFFSSTALFSAERGWNSPEFAKAYFHNSEIQRGWAWELIGQFSFENSKNVLDFGCGDGKITAELSRLVRSGNVTGVDLSHNMIQLAKLHFPKASYNNLEFKQVESETFGEISETYDVISAFSVFHFVDHPVEILQNLRTHLQPEGRLLVTIPYPPGATMREAANNCFSKYGLDTPWHDTDYSRTFLIRTPEGCRQKLEEAGYEILSMQISNTPSIFHDLNECIDWLVGTMGPNWGIPFEMSRPFFTDVAQKMLELEPTLLNEEDCMFLPAARIHVIAKPL